MNFTDSLKICLQKYIDFNGRASRSEYWWFVLLTFVVRFIPIIVLVDLAGADPSIALSAGPAVARYGPLRLVAPAARAAHYHHRCAGAVDNVHLPGDAWLQPVTGRTRWPHSRASAVTGLLGREYAFASRDPYAPPDDAGHYAGHSRCSLRAGGEFRREPILHSVRNGAAARGAFLHGLRHGSLTPLTTAS